MKKTVLMSAAKKARIALAVMAVCGFTFAGAQEAFAADPLPTTDLPVKIDTNQNIICGVASKVEGISSGNSNIVIGSGNIAIGEGANAVGGKQVPSVASGLSSKTPICCSPTNLGDLSSATGWGTVAIGGLAHAKIADSSAFGAHTFANGQASTVVGWGAMSTEDAKGSVALGYGAVAEEANVISVGRGENYADRTNLYSDLSFPIYRRIVNMADGINDHDAATVGQVKSMIAAGGGASFDGTKLNTDIQNVDVAGGYKDTATNPNADTKGTVAGAINSAYQAGKEYTDTKVSAVEGKLNTLKTNVDQNTTDISNIKTNIGDMSKLDVNGKSNLVDAVNEAYKAATSAGANVGKLDELTTTNRDNLVGAVNEVNKKADKAQTTADNALNKANDAQTTANSALNKANANENKIGDLNSLTTTEKGNLVGAVNEVNNKATANEKNIGDLTKLTTTEKGNLVGAVNEVNKKADKNAEKIEKVNGRVDTLGGAVAKLDSRVNKVGAGAAALAALHPMEFDSDNKLSFAAGVGNYRGTNAAAIGAFYRPSEQVMFSISGNMGNGENMVNAGVSFALDRPSKTPTTKAALVKTVVAQNEQIAALNETLAEQNEKIARLEAMVEKLAAQGK